MMERWKNLTSYLPRECCYPRPYSKKTAEILAGTGHATVTVGIRLASGQMLLIHIRRPRGRQAALTMAAICQEYAFLQLLGRDTICTFRLKGASFRCRQKLW